MIDLRQRSRSAGNDGCIKPEQQPAQCAHSSASDQVGIEGHSCAADCTELLLKGRTISEEAAQLAAARWVHIYTQSDGVTTTALLPSREFVARRLTRHIGKGTLCILPPGGSGPL